MPMDVLHRSGMSLPLNYVVIGLIGLVTAFTVILGFTGHMDSVGGILDGLFGQSEADLARQSCDRARTRLCTTNDYDDPQAWADDAVYNDRSCRSWAVAENIYGTGGADAIPECGG